MSHQQLVWLSEATTERSVELQRPATHAGLRKTASSASLWSSAYIEPLNYMTTPIRDTTHLTHGPTGCTVTGGLSRSRSSKSMLSGVDTEAAASSYALPILRDPKSSNQDLGIAVGPTMHQMQKWSKGKAHLAALRMEPRIPAPRAPETRSTQRTISLAHPLYSRVDALIKPTPARPRTRADERVLRHLRPNPPPQPELFDHTSVLRRGGSTYAIDFTGHMATTMRLPSMADLYNMGGA